MSATGFPALEFGKSPVTAEQKKDLERDCAYIVHELTIKGGNLRAESAEILASKLARKRAILSAGFWPRRPGEPA